MFSFGAFEKGMKIIENSSEDKDHGVWVGTRGLGSKYVPSFGPLHHAAIWVEGTLIEVAGKAKDKKITLKITHDVKISVGVAPLD